MLLFLSSLSLSSHFPTLTHSTSVYSTQCWKFNSGSHIPTTHSLNGLEQTNSFDTHTQTEVNYYVQFQSELLKQSPQCYHLTAGGGWHPQSHSNIWSILRFNVYNVIFFRFKGISAQYCHLLTSRWEIRTSTKCKPILQTWENKTIYFFPEMINKKFISTSITILSKGGVSERNNKDQKYLEEFCQEVRRQSRKDEGGENRKPPWTG